MVEKSRALAVRLFVTIVIAIFIVEFGIMMGIQSIGSAQKTILIGLIDSIILIIIMVPLLYIWFFKPIIQQINEREKIDKELQELNRELEERIDERTKELEKANKKLNENIEQLEKWQKLTVDRESKMIELKKQLNDLRKKLKKEGKGR